MADQTPGRFDRAQLERIIRRAAELQTGEHEIADELSREDVLKLGKDVGIPTRYLEQAMVEERVRTPEEAIDGFWDRVTGPALVQAMRVVRGDQRRVQHTLVDWMDEHELLGVAREQPGRILWEPIGGLNAAVRRASAAVGGSARPFMLARVRRAAATITPLESGYGHVTLEADLRDSRRGLIGGAIAVGTIGLGVAAVLSVLHAFLPLALVPIPLGAFGGWSILRQFPAHAARAQLGLERALDDLEQAGDRPAGALPPGRPGLLESVLGEVRKVLK